MKRCWKETILHNLFNDHRGGPLFQADANYGATAGVAEMLLQSHDHVVAPLTALPTAWSDGSYRGLLARGNFEVSAQWSDGQANRLEVVVQIRRRLGPKVPQYRQGRDQDFGGSAGRLRCRRALTKSASRPPKARPMWSPIFRPTLP